MTIDELKTEIGINPDGEISQAYRIGYAAGLKDKARELALMIEKLIDGRARK